jgi:hypothetical protein
MQATLDHLDNIVRPALRNYIAAELALDRANVSRGQAAIDAARAEVMRAGRTAATELHHLGDVVLIDTAPRFADLGAVRQALRAVCVFDRGRVAGPDTDLLHDAADAFKHFVLRRPSATISGAAAIVSIENGYGEMRCGEQKYDGMEEVTVRRNDGNKYSLRWICQNSYDAWMTVLALPQTPRWEY